MSTSLKDIAAALNLSKTTVSWVLSGQGEKKGISEDTRNLVLDYAKRVNYVPNLLARSLNSGSSKTIGVIVPQISDGFYAAVTDQIEQEAFDAGYSILIATSNGEIAREDQAINAFRSKMVDGMIIAPCKGSKKELLKLIDDNYPITLFDRFWPELNISHVIINNEESCYLLTKKLIRRGYKNIAFVTTNPHLLTMSMRLDGYLAAINESGIAVQDKLIRNIPYSGYKEKIIPAMDALFNEVENVDAFVFSTHILAIEAFSYFAAKGRNISSNKIGFASMHSDDLFRLITPNIDIAHFPVRDIGTNAVRILLNQINAKSKGRSYTPEFISIPCIMDYWDEK